MVTFLDRALENDSYREIDVALDAQCRIWRLLPIASYQKNTFPHNFPVPRPS
jgi:hypothetical protein